MIIFFASVLFALGMSALCSLLEATLLSYSPAQVARLNEGRPALGRVWLGFKEDIQRPIAVILIINTAAHTLGATFAGAKFEEVFIAGYGWGPNALICFGLVFTFLMLAFTEIVPKTVGVVHNERLAPLIAVPLAGAVTAFAPLLVMVRWLNRPFQPRADEDETPASLQDIATMAGLARLSRLIGPQQERIIKGASTLAQTPVADAMIPMSEATALRADQDLGAAIAVAQEDPHTRFPVCEGNDRDQVVGYVTFKELMLAARREGDDAPIAEILRPMHFVAPRESAAALLRFFVEHHVHMAIVREDERNLGLITLEDIVEEMTGDIDDEFDRAPRRFAALPSGVWLVGGGFPVAELARRLDTPLPDAAGSVSQWLLRRMPESRPRGRVHEEAGLRFVIRRFQRGHVFEASVTRIGDGQD